MESDWRSFFYKFSDKMEMASGPDGILKALKEIDVEKEIKKKVKEFPNIKSADASGMPSIKILDYNVRDNESRRAESVPQGDFVTHNELADIQREIDSLKAKLERTGEKRNGGKNDGK